jgi:hypothetical protein
MQKLLTVLALVAIAFPAISGEYGDAKLSVCMEMSKTVEEIITKRQAGTPVMEMLEYGESLTPTTMRDFYISTTVEAYKTVLVSGDQNKQEEVNRFVNSFMEGCLSIKQDELK